MLAVVLLRREEKWLQGGKYYCLPQPPRKASSWSSEQGPSWQRHRDVATQTAFKVVNPAKVTQGVSEDREKGSKESWDRPHPYHGL